MGDGSRLGLQVSYARESTPLGTGGAVRLAMERIAGDAALVLNGDSYCRFDSARLLRRHRQLGAEGTIWLQPVAAAGRYGAVHRCAADGCIIITLQKSGTVHA